MKPARRCKHTVLLPEQTIHALHPKVHKKTIIHALRERVKELTALHGSICILQNDKLSNQKILDLFINLIPPAWQYPKITVCRISFGPLKSCSKNFRETPWKQTCEARVSDNLSVNIEVCYLKKMPLEAEGVFLAEERNLINSLADMLRVYFARQLATQELLAEHKSLESRVKERTAELEKINSALKQTEASLQEANADLERRVQMRTSELEELNKELEAFSYSVAHDLVAPIRRINIFSDFLEKGSGPELTEEQRSNIQMIHKSVSLMLSLVDGLLNLSTASRKPLTKEPVLLSELLEEVITDAKAESPGRKIEWSTQSLPEVNCDRTMIRQVFANLISNAVKYTSSRETARIEITLDQAGRDHIICVRDNGVGFSMEYRDKLFGVFQRFHQSSKFSGNGIGLSIVRRIISRHGGRVWAESEPEKGALFCFTLPKS